MAWKPLAERMNDLPLVLAGPMLRRVDEHSVTVWVALKKNATVELAVWSADPVSGDPVALQCKATRETFEIGKNLHIIAVTARMLGGNKLAAGPVYLYQLLFEHDGQTEVLEHAVGGNGSASLLAYPPFKWPSFSLPPPKLSDLRIIHGSCRKPNATGPDTLSILDQLIAQTAQNGFLRPHQLLLTGDQIYADEVADSLLSALTDAGEALLGWSESMPGVGGSGPYKPTDLPPFWRWRPLADAGLTSNDLRSHLMGLGEYLAMYLFAWSDVIWPVDMAGAPTMPTSDDLAPKIRQLLEIAVDYGRFERDLEELRYGRDHDDVMDDFRAIVDANTKEVNEYRKTLPDVRRALANIPTYMICDDHEITDDWNMTREFCKGVYGHDLGMRVVQNGMVAYALCQHWGNVPEEFEVAGQYPAGLALLGYLAGGNAHYYDVNSPKLQTLVGLHSDDALLKKHTDGRVFHDEVTWTTINGKRVCIDSLHYHYSIEGPAHQIIVTDTRTWRSFPADSDPAPDLLPIEAFKQQLFGPQDGGPPDTNGRVLLVVLTTNAPPTEAIRTATGHPSLTHRNFAGGPNADLYDSWEVLSLPFHRLIARLTDRLPLVGGVRTGPVVFLSGDVHFSFASRLVYRATKRFEDPPPPSSPQPATAVFAQLVASALKNEQGKTIKMHLAGLKGYEWGPTGTKSLIPGHRTESYLGWVAPDLMDGFTTAPDTYRVSVSEAEPMLQFTQDLILKPGPDYRYQLDYLVAAGDEVQLHPPPKISPVLVGGSTDADVLKMFNAATVHYRDYNTFAGSKRDIVGLNNLGEVTFDGAGTQMRVNHTLRWLNPFALLEWTTYRVSLDPDDKDFPDVPSQITIYR
jgi:hypothetical protein